MSGKTHIAAGVLCTLVAYKINPSMPIIDLMAGAIITSKLPDIDQKTKLLRHRGETHSIVWPIILYIASLYMTNGRNIVIGAIIGLLSHLALDLMNGKGIEIIWPLNSKNYRIFDLKYEGVMEHVLFGMMLAGSTSLIVTMFIK